MSKKATKQSRRTKRRKQRQAEARTKQAAQQVSRRRLSAGEAISITGAMAALAAGSR